MAKSSDNYSIRYEGFMDLADELEKIGSSFEGTYSEIHEALELVKGYHAVYHQLGRSVVDSLKEASFTTAVLYNLLGKNGIPHAMRLVHYYASHGELMARRECHWFGETINCQLGGFSSQSIADDYYAEAQAKLDKEEADRIQAEKDEQDRIDAEQRAKEEEEKRLQELFDISPSARQEYEDRITEAKFQEMMEAYKDDPVMLEKIKQDYEAWKKSKELAAQVSDELGEISDGISSDSSDWGSSGYSSDYSSDYGGYSSDYGDYGSDYGSDWATSDWSSDLLSDSVDSSDYWDASESLDGIMGASIDDALSGAEAAADAADIAEPGMFDEFGGQLASVVQSYGLQAALAIGGGVALYATREQTIEAAAHVAEFVSTKCKPAVNDVMDQVKGMAKKARVNLSNAKSNVKAAVRGEKAGDLIG